MNLNRLLLLKADHQPSREDLQAALHLARNTGAALTFADLLPDGDAVSDFFHGEHRRQLEDILAPHNTGVEVAYRVLSGSPAEALRGLEPDHDLVLPAGGSRRFLTELLRSAPMPVWVAGSTAIPPRRILAAVDVDRDPEASGLDRRILDTSLALADQLGAELEVASVWTPPGPGSRFVGRPAEGSRLKHRAESAGRRVRELLDQALAAAPPGARRPPVHLEGGHPAELLAEMIAARGVDLLVAGHNGRSGLPAWLIGNTAEKLADRVDCSLLTVSAAADDDSARAA